MKDPKRKRTMMFLEADGKCEYCGRDMVLSYSIHKSKEVPDNVATLDHKYNRDHEERTLSSDLGKRIFIVCSKCNSEKSVIEPNRQLPSSTEKTVKKIVPKEKWSDEKFMSKMEELVERERTLCMEQGNIDKQMDRLLHNKGKIQIQLSKLVKYRNLLLDIRSEFENNLQPSNNE